MTLNYRGRVDVISRKTVSTYRVKFGLPSPPYQKFLDPPLWHPIPNPIPNEPLEGVMENQTSWIEHFSESCVFEFVRKSSKKLLVRFHGI